MALGVWNYTRDFDHQSDVDGDGNPLKARSQGLYILADHPLGANASMFYRHGWASSAANRFKSSFSTGVVLKEFLGGRPDDQLAMGLTIATNGVEYKQAQASPVDGSESAFELTYRAELGRGFALQPDFQYVMNPNTDPAVKNATVLAIRAEISL